VKKTDAVKKAREYADAGCRSGKDRIDCNGCIDDLAKLIEEVHAAGKREGIEAAAKKVEELLMQPIRLIPMTPTKEKETRDDIRRGYQSALRVIRALLQTEARAEPGTFIEWEFAGGGLVAEIPAPDPNTCSCGHPKHEGRCGAVLGRGGSGHNLFCRCDSSTGG
jgi:hypothetical protein